MRAPSSAGARPRLWRLFDVASVHAMPWTERVLLREQERQLRALVRHAYTRVPFYRERFQQAGLSPDDIRDVGQLSLLPIVDREALQTAPTSALLSEGLDPRSLVKLCTSGSSGAPLTVYRSPFEERLLLSVRLRRAALMGMRPWEPRVFIAGPQAIEWPGLDGREHAPVYERLGLLRRINLDCRKEPEEVLSALRRAAPRRFTVHGFTTGIAQVAALMTDADRRRLRPRFVTGGAETLTPQLRRQIERGFGATFYDHYGSNEFNLQAGQLPGAEALVVPRETVLVEVLRDGRPAGEGEEGEVVATALRSFAMPMIRYRLGDVVVRGRAGDPAGLTAATLREVRGRRVERMVLPGGATLHPYTLVDLLLERAPWVSRYQIVQVAIDRLRVRVSPLPGATPPAATLAELERALGDCIDDRVTLKVELVQELLEEGRSKHRPFVGLGEASASPGVVDGGELTRP